ncbi:MULTISPECIES: metallophosphoesterase family protein [Pseudanabaena]|uniref:Metallophosphoesterase n=2 Tax=Pseudanabaena TaxID=1152 RepID=L8MTS8_9CYAN|nr:MULTISPECIES: metallophosphoesterase [Pseudanabaena]ELS30836.1 metallophosphoesterase [Pseudanabaena biceps PCC 7429]MDG3496890.1 metallophosphoesterase [Pseudanabaena catenata USMAC16]
MESLTNLQSAFFLGLAVAIAPAASAETYQWVQYAPKGIEARVITDRSSCPIATIDGQEATMTPRAKPNELYPVLVCALPIPKTTKSVAIENVPLKLPVAEPKKILLIGDTGCRMKGKKVQACNDPIKWPFRLVAEVAAQMKPDLVLHVGDYHYRETACPEGNTGCAGSPYGDNWAVWRADFFSPADNLLRVAPWVFTRGNHEECKRGGKGWSRALDPYAFDEEKGCVGMGEPFMATFNTFNIAVMDVSTADEEKANESEVKKFSEQFRAIGKMSRRPTWITLHRPIWSAEEIKDGKPIGFNVTLAEAAKTNIPSNVVALLSGHHHSFQLFNYEGSIPPQIVAGHGGDYLDSGVPLNPAGMVINGITVKSGFNQPNEFGFAMMEKDGNNWKLTNYDRFGKVLKSCILKDKQVSCSAN